MLKVSHKVFALKSFIHLAALSIVALLYYKAIVDLLGSDPVKEVIHFTGLGGLNLLLLTLLVSPVAKRFKLGWLLRVRRLLGLYAFFYACLHLLSYGAFELQWDFSLLGSEIIERPYITVGMVVFSLLLMLAVTSPDYFKRKLGKRWQKMHNAIYVIILLVPVHFYWSVKSDVSEPLVYFLLAFIALGLRWGKLRGWLKRRSIK
ncbi:MAG: sulfoxide reductase heme-binding subunit YedZ [Phenylobacterium sp.]